MLSPYWMIIESEKGNQAFTIGQGFSSPDGEC